MTERNKENQAEFVIVRKQAFEMSFSYIWEIDLRTKKLNQLYNW